MFIYLKIFSIDIENYPTFMTNYPNVIVSFNCYSVKRVSDQRLAELETLLALSKMSGKLVTVPLAFGKIDPAKM